MKKMAIVIAIVAGGMACGGCDQLGEKTAAQPTMTDFTDSPVTINYGSGNTTDNSRRDNPPKE